MVSGCSRLPAPPARMMPLRDMAQNIVGYNMHSWEGCAGAHARQDCGADLIVTARDYKICLREVKSGRDRGICLMRQRANSHTARGGRAQPRPDELADATEDKNHAGTPSRSPA